MNGRFMIKEAIKWATCTFCWFKIINDYVFEIVTCVGPSMYPTINQNGNGDVVIVQKSLFQPKKNDIVIFKEPHDPNLLLCKRITKTAYDTFYYGGNYIKVSKGHCWVTGDNGLDSTDSRDFGQIPQGLIVGKVIFRIYPINKIGSL